MSSSTLAVSSCIRAQLFSAHVSQSSLIVHVTRSNVAADLISRRSRLVSDASVYFKRRRSYRQHTQTMPTTQARTSRPTTPLRRVERGSLSALGNSRGAGDDAETGAPSSGDTFPLNALDIAFADLADSLADLQANMQQICDLGDEVSRFDESFASFLYGLNVNAFCVDFPEAPVAESYRRAAERQRQQETRWEPLNVNGGGVMPSSDATYMTTDDSFVERPLAPPAHSTAAPSSSAGGKFGTASTRSQSGTTTQRTGQATRGGTASTRGRGGSRGARTTSGTRPR